jgi:HSP20 family protein
MDTQQELQVQQKREVESKQEATIPARVFVPATDIFETDEALTVILEMPGVDKDKVDVKVENDVLQIEGWIDRSGPGCLNNFSASISGASAGVRLPSGGAAG